VKVPSTKVADDRWRGQAIILGKRRGVYGRTKKEAQQKLRKLLGDADRGLLPPPEKLTLDAYLERWFEDVVKPSVRPRTHKGYHDLARLHLLPVLGQVKLPMLQPGHLQNVYQGMQNRGLSAHTVHRVHSVIRSALNQAVEWNLVPRNVALAAHPPTPRREEMKTLTVAQMRILLHDVKGTRWEPLLSLALTTGMRQGEILGLRWSELDFDAGTVRVTRQLDRSKQLAEPKSKAARRQMHLPAPVLVVLREHKRRQNEERLVLGEEYQSQDLVFCTQLGHPLGHRNVQRDFKLRLAKSGLPEIRFHDLRHTSASLMLLQGVHPKVVQERLGHSQISLTLDTYSHVMTGMDREAADKLTALLLPSSDFELGPSP